MALNEFELIERFFQKELGGRGVALGVGDDCALLQPPEGKVLAVSCDTLVGGNHFPKNADPELIAERAMRVNLSDLAAMGAEPLWFTLALSLPSADSYWLDGFSRGLFQAANKYNCSLVGGDTTRGPLSITIQVMGAVDLESSLKRNGARVGDMVYVTGELGDAAAAVAVIKKTLDVGKSAFSFFMSRYYRPIPKIAEGRLLRGIASAAIDISDGLVADLGHICKASGVGAVIDLERIPVSEPLKKLASREQLAEWTLAGGDDYQLCFTVPADQTAIIEHMIDSKKLEAIAIGEITRGNKVVCMSKGKEISLKKTGYQHFESKKGA
ncbi:MAG: thiamine-phosphate kinase [Cellvibrionaceae bacterium]